MKTIAQGAVLILLGLGVGVGLMEGVLRVFHLAVPLQYAPNPWYGWGHTPNARVWRVQEGQEVEVAINDLGLRDDAHSYEKAIHTYRILVLGDSFAEAVQVPLAKSFPKLLESLLNERKAGLSSRYEVINAGASGYGTDNELLFFRAEGMKYKPDLVLLEFCICNDVRNNWYELDVLESGGLRKPYFTLRGEDLVLQNYPFEREETFLHPVKAWLNRHVRLYPFLREVRDRLSSATGGASSGVPLDYEVFASEYREPWSTAWQVTRGLLREVKKEVAANNARLFVMIVPTRFQVRADDWKQVMDIYGEMKKYKWDLEKPNRLLRQILEEEGISYVDLLPSFHRHAENTNAQLYLPSDGHWNQDGHRLATDVLGEALHKYLEAATPASEGPGQISLVAR